MHKLTIALLGTFLVGALITPTSGFAKDYWHWSKNNNNWDRRADVRSDYHDLERAKRQLDNDRRHHASRRKIAEDQARIREIERDIHADRTARR